MSCKAEGFTACTKRFTTDYCKKHYSQVRKYGKYKLVEDAAKIYNEVALKLYGEFAYQNKVGA